MRSLRLVMALCAIISATACARRVDITNKNIIVVDSPTSPSPTPAPAPAPAPTPTSAPGAFELHGTCTSANKASLRWTASAGADHYAVVHWAWTTHTNEATVLELFGTTVELAVDQSADNYWRIIAINAVGRTTSFSPDERIGEQDRTFACGKPKAACDDNLDNDRDGKIDSADPGCHTDGNPNNSASWDRNDNDETDVPFASAPPGTPGNPGPPGTPSNPTPPNTFCSGMSWSPTKSSGHVGELFGVSINSGGCQVVLESNEPSNVSVSNSGGRFVAVGGASVCLRDLAGKAVSQCSTLTTIP
jgi:hypothetical protein